MLLFLFVAGLDVDLRDLRREGRRPIPIGLVGTLLPIAAGLALAYTLPRSFWGSVAVGHFLSFALFIGISLANSANPAIARVLMDLGLLRTSVGSMVMSATIVDDLTNWTLFAIILSDDAPGRQGAGGSLGISILAVAGFFVVVLGLGRRYGAGALHWLRAHVAWPSGFIALTVVVILVTGSASGRP